MRWPCVLAIALSGCRLIDAAGDDDDGEECEDQECFSVGEVGELGAPNALAAGPLVGGDSLPDLVVADTAGNRVLLLGNRDGDDLETRGELSIGQPVWLGVGDFAPSPGLEILCLSAAREELVVVRVDGQGDLSEIGSTPLASSVAEVVIGQLDGLGGDEVAVLYPDAGVLDIVHNVDGALSVGASFQPGPGSRPLLAVDLDDDGDVDLFTVHDLQLKVFAGDGSRGFADYQIVGSVDAPVDAAVAVDVDGDSLPELALSLGDRLEYRQNGFSDVFDGSTFSEELDRLELPAPARLLAAGDFDDDGLPDIAAVHLRRTGDDPDAVLVRAQTDGSFDDSVYLFLEDPVDGAVAADMNDDSRTDLVISSRAAGAVRGYLSEL
jgi:hypothetical protein